MPSARQASAGSGCGSAPRLPDAQRVGQPRRRIDRADQRPPSLARRQRAQRRGGRRLADAARADADEDPFLLRERLEHVTSWFYRDARRPPATRTSIAEMLSGPPASLAASISSWQAASSRPSTAGSPPIFVVGDRRPTGRRCTAGRCRPAATARRRPSGRARPCCPGMVTTLRCEKVAISSSRHVGTRRHHLLHDRVVARQAIDPTRRAMR